MKFHKILGFAAIVCFQGKLLATSCSVPPPCARVRLNSILFVGVVMDAGVPKGPKEDSERDVRMQVEEIFTGLPPSLKEVVVTTEGSWLEKGHSYLIDAAEGNDHHFYPRICGATDEVNSRTGVLEYLRERKLGKTKTSLTINVTDQHKPVPDVAVTVSSSDRTFTSQTGLDGIAVFDVLQPAKYRVTAARAHYHLDTENHSDEAVDVPLGTCTSSWIALSAEAEVSGLVRDAKGTAIASLQLELLSIPKDSFQKLTPNEPWFEAQTDAGGRFRFESVSPGRYYLGANIMDYLRRSSVPRTYYPGQRSRDGAIPIEVKLGEAAENLLFTLPDFGPSRTIQLCVVDENSNPAPFSRIGDASEKLGADFANLGENLQTDETGCLKANGYTRAAYAVRASLAAPGGDFRQARFSDSVVIPPGDDSVRQVLTLKKALGIPKFTKQ